MPAVSIITNANAVTVRLDQFRLALGDRTALMETIGQTQLRSVYRTFEDEGSPAGSWAPLAASTLRNKRYTSGHKLLILSGRLRNSINAQASGNSVQIGTNVVYARVQFLGTKGQTLKVKAHKGKLLLAHHYTQREVKGKDGKSYMVPQPEYVGRSLVVDRRGRQTTVRSRFEGPRQMRSYDVKGHERAGGIPARNPLVFRPDDPERIASTVVRFVAQAAMDAGLEVAE